MNTDTCQHDFEGGYCIDCCIANYCSFCRDNRHEGYSCKHCEDGKNLCYDCVDECEYCYERICLLCQRENNCSQC